MYVVESGNHGIELSVGSFPYNEDAVDESLPEAGFDRFVFEEAIFEFCHEEIG